MLFIGNRFEPQSPNWKTSICLTTLEVWLFFFKHLLSNIFIQGELFPWTLNHKSRWPPTVLWGRLACCLKHVNRLALSNSNLVERKKKSVHKSVKARNMGLPGEVRVEGVQSHNWWAMKKTLICFIWAKSKSQAWLRPLGATQCHVAMVILPPAQRLLLLSRRAQPPRWEGERVMGTKSKAAEAKDR